MRNHMLGAPSSVIGNEAPLVSRNTVDAGVQYRQPQCAQSEEPDRFVRRSGGSQVVGRGPVEKSHQQVLECRILAGRLPVGERYRAAAALIWVITSEPMT
jgi:hypothetical protein